MTRNEEVAIGLAALIGGILFFTTRRSNEKPPSSRSANGTSAPTVWDNVQETSIWPVSPAKIQRLGQTVMEHRGRRGDEDRPHKGIDIFADADTEVRAAQRGKVIQVTDGRTSTRQERRDAGLWIDVESREKGNPIYRYLHLGDAYVKEGDSVARGDVIGIVAPPNTSGLGNDPHLHFEIRSQDGKDKTGYGPPIDPLTRLPKLPQSTVGA